MVTCTSRLNIKSTSLHHVHLLDYISTNEIQLYSYMPLYADDVMSWLQTLGESCAKLPHIPSALRCLHWWMSGLAPSPTPPPPNVQQQYLLRRIYIYISLYLDILTSSPSNITCQQCFCQTVSGDHVSSQPRIRLSDVLSVMNVESLRHQEASRCCLPLQGILDVILLITGYLFVSNLIVRPFMHSQAFTFILDVSSYNLATFWILAF